ncbi:hypothetical protein [Pantoea dispersa]|uniref:hypothetical protein n=1 Tax=Pantoea dispersa TaxID=59814 RepID=UPI001331A20A|nr:hypothetical protein [Pantoea dispersa]KAF0856738.1 hypothetical protein Y788_04810 [Pantoea dispersa 625]
MMSKNNLTANGYLKFLILGIWNEEELTARYNNRNVDTPQTKEAMLWALEAYRRLRGGNEDHQEKDNGSI